MSKELIEKVLNSKKVKYELLKPMLAPYIDFRAKEQNVNIFIDVYDILKQLYNPNTIETFRSLKNRDRYVFTPELVNLISHYRHYFASRMSKYTTFYFFCSTSPSEYHTKIYEDYKKDFYNKRLDKSNEIFGHLNTIILDNFKVLNLIMEYIPHAYFINTGKHESNVIPYYFLKERISEDDFNIIISNDDVYYQDLLVLDNTVQLELRGDKTRIITRENMYDYLLEKNKKNPLDFPHITAEMIEIIYPLYSHKNYNTPSIKNMGFSKAIAFFEKMAKNQDIDPLLDYKANDELFNPMRKNGFSDKDIEKYLVNYKLFNHSDVLNNNLKSYKNLVDVSLIDRVDAKGVRVTNERYFPNNPILLDFCFEGEDYQ